MRIDQNDAFFRRDYKLNYIVKKHNVRGFLYALNDRNGIMGLEWKMDINKEKRRMCKNNMRQRKNNEGLLDKID